MNFQYSRLASFLVLSAALLACSTSAEKGKKKKTTMSVEKGVKCKGGGDMTKSSKECKGGMKMDFAVHYGVMDIMEEIAEGVHDHLESSFLPDAREMLIPEDDDIVLQQMMAAWQQVATEEANEDVDISKTFEFGGMAKVEWGCNVTYAHKKGVFSKTAECGFKSDSGTGMLKTGGILQDEELIPFTA